MPTSRSRPTLDAAALHSIGPSATRQDWARRRVSPIGLAPAHRSEEAGIAVRAATTRR